MKNKELSKICKDYVDNLVSEIKTEESSDRLISYFDFCSRFHNYSFNNRILIWMQKPDATRVAGFKTWQKMGRWVKKGEKGIAIFAPMKIRIREKDDWESDLELDEFDPSDGNEVVENEEIEPGEEKEKILFKVVYVWDVSQTDGDPLPEAPDVMSVQGDAGMLLPALEDAVQSRGIQLEYMASVFTSEQIGLVARVTGKSVDDVQSAMQELAAKSSYYRMAEGIEAVRDRLGMQSTDEVFREMSKAGVADFQGTYKAFEAARNTGFKGDINDYIAFQKEMDTLERYNKVDQIRSLAMDKGFAGMSDYFKNRQAYIQSQEVALTGQVVDSARERHVSVSDIGDLLGRARAMSELAKHDVVKNAALSGWYLTQAGKYYNEASKMVIRQALNNIAEKGQISAPVQETLQGIASDPAGRAQLATQGIGDRVIKRDEAENVAKYLEKHGVKVDPEKLEGATAQWNVWVDDNGELQTSMLATKKGTVVTESNYARSEMSLNGKQVEEITGKKGPAGKYTIYSTPEGYIVGIKGEGGFRASTGNVIYKETAFGGALEKVTIDPDTGQKVTSMLKTGPEIRPGDMLNAVLEKS